MCEEVTSVSSNLIHLFCSELVSALVYVLLFERSSVSSGLSTSVCNELVSALV